MFSLRAERPEIRAWRTTMACRSWSSGTPRRASRARTRWRGVTYRVDEVLSRWPLRDRWWERSNPDHPRGGTTDRLYYRMMSKLREFGSLAVFEISFDRAQNVWVLDREYD